MRKLLCVLAFLLHVFLFAFDCKSVSIEDEFELSDLVVIAYVDNIPSSSTFRVKILEEIKGHSDTNVLLVENKGFQDYESGKWLIFLKKKKQSWHYNPCGWSRSYSKPVSYSSFDGIKPPKVNLSLNSIYQKLVEIEMQNKLTNDIELVRNWALSSTLSSLTEENNLLRKELQYLKYALFFIGLIILILFFLILRKIKNMCYTEDAITSAK